MPPNNPTMMIPKFDRELRTARGEVHGEKKRMGSDELMATSTPSPPITVDTTYPPRLAHKHLEQRPTGAAGP